MNFYPKVLPCDLENIDIDVNSIMEGQERIRTLIKILYTMIEKIEIESYFNNNDFTNTLENLSNEYTLMSHQIATVKAELNYLMGKEEDKPDDTI